MNKQTGMNNFLNFIRYAIFISFWTLSPNFGQQEIVESYLRGMVITDIKNDGADIWVATEGNGIYKYSKANNLWINFSSENNTIKQDFFYCIEVSPKFIWAGSVDGLYTYDKRRNRWSKRKFALGGQFGNWIRALQFVRSNNTLWIGRFKYLTSYNLTSKRYNDIDLTIGKNDKTNSVQTLTLDNGNILWVGVESGVHKISLNSSNDENNPEIKYFDSKGDYFLGEGKHVSISKILPDDDFLWFATDEFVTKENPEFNTGGLFRFDRKINWIKFDEYNKFNSNGVFTLEKTGKYIWSSVYKFDSQRKEPIGQGVYLINRNNLNVLKIENNLLPETIISLHFDGSSIWLGSNNGLYKITLKNDFIANFDN